VPATGLVRGFPWGRLMSTTAVPDPAGAPGLRMSSAGGRWVVAATVLGSGMAALDATVVGIAIPAIGRNFGAGVASLQWVVDAYTLTLAGLLLLGGTLGDSYGRRKVFMAGTVWFALASLLCGLAPNAGVLIAPRRPPAGPGPRSARVWAAG
jgi:MFS family permease